MLNKNLINEVLDAALSTGADFAEVFLERSETKRMVMNDNSIHRIQGSNISGMGLRIYKGLRAVYGSTGDLSRTGVLSLARSVAGAFDEGRAVDRVVLAERIPANVHPIQIVPSSIENRRKIDLVKKANDAARSYDSAISQVRASLLDVDRRFWIANSEGLYTGDRQIYTRLFADVTASKDGENQSGFYGPGRQAGLETFLSWIDPAEVGKEAARQAVVNLNAGYCKAGSYPVAIENGFGGVIFHEATGHSLEATQVAYGVSEFCGKLGQKIASEKVTAIDDGTIPNAWGSINIDDEGRPGQRNVLIEKGVLKGYLVDAFNARRMEGFKPTGNARRQDFQFSPTSRMTNTFIAPGEDEDEDIIGSMELGLYCRNMGGGSVNPATGAFNFGVGECYMVRNGKIAEPVRGAALIGKGSEVIKNIDMVGKHLEHGAGMCGSSSGSIPVNVGQPLIRVSGMTVGGR
ncbi:MAG: TldD/PmbA family protein [Sphaerochaetaceae bacterium]